MHLSQGAVFQASSGAVGRTEGESGTRARHRGIFGMDFEESGPRLENPFRAI